MREGEERKPLVRRDPYKEAPALLRRTTPHLTSDGRTVYYTSGRGVTLVTDPDPLGAWYRRLNDWGEKLIDFVERLEGGPFGPAERRDTVDSVVEDPVETTKQAARALRLMMKAGHVMVLAIWVLLCLVYHRMMHLFGSH